MKARDTSRGFGYVTRMLHLTAIVLVCSQLALGWGMAWVGRGERKSFIFAHETLGLVILVLGAVFAIWVSANPKPEHLTVKGLQKTIAHGMHYLLLAMMIFEPILGILTVMLHGYGVHFFGWTLAGGIGGRHHAMAEVADDLHVGLAAVFALAAAAHAAAALHHGLVIKDDVLTAMFGRRSEATVPDSGTVSSVDGDSA